MVEKLIVKPERLHEVIKTIFLRNGLSDADAGTVADNLVDANIRGVHSHGVLRTVNYVDRIKAGGTNPHPDIRIVSETPSSAVIDGDNGMGSVVSMYAVELCRKKAAESGVAVVTVKNSNHYGTAAFYCERLAGDDMIAFSASNVEPNMTLPGALKVTIGNNPFCMVAPAGKHINFCSDMASSQIAWGKVLNYRLNKEKLPGVYAIDENGNPTDDAEAARYLMPMGAHKGYGVAAQLEILCSLLSGGAFGTQIGSMYNDVSAPNKLSHVFIAINISAFRDLDEFKASMDEFMDYLQSIPTADGGHVIVPGEIEENCKRHSYEVGIEITEELARELIGMASDDPDVDPEVFFQ